MDPKVYARGEAMRRQVLGDEHVNKSMLDANGFGKSLQDLVMEYGWGAVWARPGLAPKIRSLINIAMLTALNRPHEFKVHLRGAFRNGCTLEEIEEVLLQTTLYCGGPAALDAVRWAREVINEKK